jgi:hypothetical protein
MHYFYLENRNGGWVSISKEDYFTWQKSPAAACESRELLDKLRANTHDRGFNYDDFSLRFRVTLESGQEIYSSLLDKAYEIGMPRGCSLSIGYYVSEDGTEIFCRNHDSESGVLVWFDSIQNSFVDTFVLSAPKTFVCFDMYTARNF